ncbi:ABC transporter permease [Aurantimonas sp. VKM B-3413]|uniref:ABC transporter permease n=1 Tax=Aurantimonas sp. VKM B-3413 TaxID=2779401 RepID=UPI001E53B092|nr:ABC transporter permease [Aurantimonas sp. VKM B-3413]MCB8838301.1 ABC transporter permease [Aurantimonas sp. VKM B-3413]
MSDVPSVLSAGTRRGEGAATLADGAAAVERRPARPARRSSRFGFRKPLPRALELTIALGASAALLLLWEAIARLGFVNTLFFPAPSDVAAAMVRMFADQHLAWHAGVSTLRVWSAFLLAAVMAIPMGILMSSYRVIGAASEPVIDFIRYLPVPALVPLAIIWFGVGEETKIFLLWLGTFFQLVLLVADDMRRVPQEYIEITQTLGGRPRQILRDVAFRAMLPNLVDNLRVTLGWCWTYLIIAEIVAASSGIGFVIWAARRYMKTPEVMAGVVLIGIIGLASDQILRAVHRRMFRYL